MNGLIPLVLQCAKQLGLQCSCSFKFHRHAISRIAKAIRTNGFNVKTLKTENSKLMMYKSHYGPQLEYCPIISPKTLRVCRILIEKLTGIHKETSRAKSSLSYRERRELLQLDSLWLCYVKLNPTLFFEIPKVASIHGWKPYPVCQRPFFSPQKLSVIPFSTTSQDLFQVSIVHI